MNRVKTCAECGETKDKVSFVIENGKRTDICIDCAEGKNQEFLDAINHMGDEFTPVDKLEFPDDDEQPS